MSFLPKSLRDLTDYETGYKDGRSGAAVSIPPGSNTRSYLDGYDDGVNVKLARQ